jgi:hypothetical protein
MIVGSSSTVLVISLMPVEGTDAVEGVEGVDKTCGVVAARMGKEGAPPATRAGCVWPLRPLATDCTPVVRRRAADPRSFCIGCCSLDAPMCAALSIKRMTSGNQPHLATNIAQIFIGQRAELLVRASAAKFLA